SPRPAELPSARSRFLLHRSLQAPDCALERPVWTGEAPMPGPRALLALVLLPPRHGASSALTASWISRRAANAACESPIRPRLYSYASRASTTASSAPASAATSWAVSGSNARLHPLHPGVHMFLWVLRSLISISTSLGLTSPT